MAVFRFLRRPADAPDEAPAPAVPDEVSPAPAPDEVPAPLEPPITWTAQLTATSLDEAARLRLVDDLRLVGTPWAIAVLRCAHEEEQTPELRAKIEAALTACGEPIAAT